MITFWTMVKTYINQSLRWLTGDDHGCYGCHLDNQWVGSDYSDHTCTIKGNE